MCFSAEADLVGGVVVGLAAIDAARHVRCPRERALVALPIVLAVHQLIEVLVWKGLEGDLSRAWWRPAMVAYLVIAFGVVPFLVPLAVEALEPKTQRLRYALFTALGAAVAAHLLWALARGPVDARIVGHHINYEVQMSHGVGVVGLYLVATCGSLLLSGQRHIRRWGVLNLAAALALAALYQVGFISLWCIWAAVTSLAIVWHLRRGDRMAVPPRHMAPAANTHAASVAADT